MTTVNDDFSIVAVDRFIQATRDSGYKGTENAVAELVDNSLQAGATWISVWVKEEAGQDPPLVLSVLDNGAGMDAATLRSALRFGGSSRFNDRSGLGRFGMGLPNSSFSQARRLEVHSWTSGCGPVLWSYLDLDEIAAGDQTAVPTPVRVTRPPFAVGHDSGTFVTWRRCDRLRYRRETTNAKHLRRALGRVFRDFIVGGVDLEVNGEPVHAIDPLFLDPAARYSGASVYYDHTFKVRSAATSDVAGEVRVRFSELPVAAWAGLSQEEKRERNISKGAGVSIVRAGREVDSGWFFLGKKRRENYDDWWRCEVSFEPVLDEAFGLTHTKQQISPQPFLREVLDEAMEPIAVTLNRRARKAHKRAKEQRVFKGTTDRAQSKERLLQPLPEGERPRDERVLRALAARLPAAPDAALAQGAAGFTIFPSSLGAGAFFDYARRDEGLVLLLNSEHPFYKKVYQPLLDNQRDGLRQQLELMLMALARAEALIEDDEQLRATDALRERWGDTLATYLAD